MEDKLEEIHEELLAWAEGLGVKVHGIRPMRLSGRGFGGTVVFSPSPFRQSKDMAAALLGCTLCRFCEYDHNDCLLSRAKCGTEWCLY